MHFPNRRDLWSGLLFIVTGLAFMVLAAEYPLGTADRMGPGYFPTLLGGLMAVLGLVVAIGAALPGAARTTVEKMDFKSIVLVLVAVAVYAATLPTLGFVVSLVLLISISSFASHEFSVKTTLMSTVVLLVFSWAVFVKGLELQFPFLPAFLTK